MMRRLRLLAVGAIAVVASAHVGSPNVFFTGRAGPYDIRVTVRPPQVVPGIARVTVRAPADVERVSIRPVYWRAGSKGAPSADETRRLHRDSTTFDGSLWLMARGAYSVDVIVEGARGNANVLVPVAAVATGRLLMGPGLGALLAVLGIVLCAGLVNIVYKAAGESLLEPAAAMDVMRTRRARRVAAISIPILGLALLGGARWWTAVDDDYERTIYSPSPLELSLTANVLQLRATDTLWQPPGRPSAFVPDHGKLMHLLLVRADDARAFAHLHPVPLDSSPMPAFETRLPPLPGGTYHVYGDVVHETGFERTLVGSLTLAESSLTREMAPQGAALDPDDAWFLGDASRDSVARLADGSTMVMDVVPHRLLTAESDVTIRVSVRDARGNAARLEPYLGMPAHAVLVRVDGDVYVHLHPLGTITRAAQDAFVARDRGDTTASGRLRLASAAHATHAAAVDSLGSVEFPYAFPRGGSYRLFVQVKRNGRVLTGAYGITVAEAVAPR